MGLGRYVMFVISITFVASLFIFQVPEKETILFYAFIIGNDDDMEEEGVGS